MENRLKKLFAEHAQLLKETEKYQWMKLYPQYISKAAKDLAVVANNVRVFADLSIDSLDVTNDFLESYYNDNIERLHDQGHRSTDFKVDLASLFQYIREEVERYFDFRFYHVDMGYVVDDGNKQVEKSSNLMFQWYGHRIVFYCALKDMLNTVYPDMQGNSVPDIPLAEKERVYRMIHQEVETSGYHLYDSHRKMTENKNCTTMVVNILPLCIKMAELTAKVYEEEDTVLWSLTLHDVGVVEKDATLAECMKHYFDYVNQLVAENVEIFSILLQVVAEEEKLEAFDDYLPFEVLDGRISIYASKGGESTRISRSGSNVVIYPLACKEGWILKNRF